MKKLFSIKKMAGLLALRTVTLAAMIGLTAASLAHAGTEQAVTWRQCAAISVGLAPGQPASYVVRGELYATDDELLPGTTVQLLIHGATDKHDYWDFGRVDGITHSYAQDIAVHGFPAFEVDILGSGDRSDPLSDQLTVQTAAYVAHEIVQGLRSGSITGVQFGRVIAVGRSSGSAVVWKEATTYGDVDGVILTGVAHSLATRFWELAKADFYPAIDDPKFSSSHLDAGYLNTVAGTSAPIRVPVLAILGSDDAATCGPNTSGGNFDCSLSAVVAATQDAPFYWPQARIHACVVPASGHDVSLAVNRGLQVADAVAWSSAFVGQYRFGERRYFDDLDHDENSLPGNGGLPWNCS